MVLGRRELSVVLLIFGAIFCVYVVLLAGPIAAQGGGGSTGQQDPGCPNPQLVETFTGTENQITEPFEITGNTFRLSYDITDVDEDPAFDSFLIQAIEEDGFQAGDSVLVFDEGNGTVNILEGPGTFYLEIESDGFEYTVTVEDCTQAGQGSSNQSSVIQGQSNSVITNTIPNKPLPPTGGWSVKALVASSILAGAGLLGLRLGIWNRRR